METRKLEKKKFSGASKVNDTLETIKKNKHKETKPLVPRSEKLPRKQKEESSHSQVASFVTSLAGSVRDVPDGTKQEITTKKISEKTKKEVPSKQENISQDKYFYVYGITNNEEIKLDLKGLKNQPIQKFEIKDIAVLFSFYPALHPMVEEKEALLHAEILNKLATRTTIVPMAFGTVFKDQEILKTVLTKSYPAIKKTLELIKDKIELGVKVVKKGSQNVSKEINQKFLDELDKLGFKLVKEGEIISGETNQNILEELNKLGFKLVKKEEEDISDETQKILEELNKLSVKSVAGDKFSERLLLNNSFLVGKNNFTQFSDKVGVLEQKYQNLKFIYTGPWPAYSFVNININAG